MITDEVMRACLDSLKHPFVFVDTDHVIQYMNKAAFERYKGRPAEVGRSIFDCHNDKSNRIIVDVFGRLKQGEDEEIIADIDGHKVYMRAVRAEGGRMMGYYERFEPAPPPA